MLRRIRVGQRLIAGFALLILAVLAAAAVGTWKMSAMKDRADYIAGTPLQAVQVLSVTNKAVAHHRLQQWALVTSTDPSERAAILKKIDAAEKDALDGLASYTPLIDGDADRAGVDRIRTQLDAYRSATAGLPALVAAGAGERARTQLLGSRDVFDALDAAVVEHRAFNTRRAERAVADTASAFSAAKVVLFGFAGIAMITGVLLALLITRSITGPLGQLKQRLAEVGDGDLTVRLDVHGADELADVGRTFNGFAERIQEVMRRVSDAAREQVEVAGDMARGAEQTGLAVAQIATTVDEVARGSQEQAEATSRVSGTMHGMGESVMKVASAGESAAAMAEEADRAAGEGARTVGDATAAMEGIERSVADAAEIVVALGERGSEVGQIVDTISDIAEQTNLLALNAAIEAARAGDMGRGFAVVADEVRKLAESTQEQVGSISAIVSEIQRHTERAVAAMEAGRGEVTTGVGRVGAAGDAFATIRDRVTALSGEVMAVAAAAEEMEAGAAEVRESLTSVAAVSEENAASVQEVSASTEETSATAQETAASAQQVAGSARQLGELVAVFRV